MPTGLSFAVSPPPTFLEEPMRHLQPPLTFDIRLHRAHSAARGAAQKGSKSRSECKSSSLSTMQRVAITVSMVLRTVSPRARSRR